MKNIFFVFFLIPIKEACDRSGPDVYKKFNFCDFATGPFLRHFTTHVREFRRCAQSVIPRKKDDDARCRNRTSADEFYGVAGGNLATAALGKCNSYGASPIAFPPALIVLGRCSGSYLPVTPTSGAQSISGAASVSRMRTPTALASAIVALPWKSTPGDISWTSPN